MTTITLPAGLATLATVPNWVNWQLEPRPGDPKPTKVPYTPSLTGNREKAKAGDPTTWGDFATASAAAETGRFTGLGFEFHTDEGRLLFDLDHVIDDAGKIAPVARAIMALANSYSEPSPSNTGIRIIALGELPRPLIAEDRQGKKKGGCELYGGAHFGTLTCRPFKGYDQLRAIDAATMVRLFALMWPEDMSPKAAPVAALPPLAPATGDDAALLEQAFTAKNGADFHARHTGAYLLEDRSADDFAYLMTLAFWTQNDAARMRGVALASGRVREKWLARRGAGDLLDYSIAKACGEQHTIYDPGQRNGARFVVPETGEVVTDFAPLAARFTRELAERDRELARTARLLAHCREEHARKDRRIAELETENAALEAGIKHPDQAAGVGAFDLIEAAERARKKGDILTRDGKDYARVPFKQAVNRRSQTTLARGFKSIQEAGKLDAFTRTERIETPTYKGDVPIAYIHIPTALHGRRGAAVLSILPEVTAKKHGGPRTIAVPPEVAAQPNPVRRERELVTRWYDAFSKEKIVTEAPTPLGTDYWVSLSEQRTATAQFAQRTAAEIEALRVQVGYQPAPAKPWQPTQPTQQALRIVPASEPFQDETVSPHPAPEPFQLDAIEHVVNRRQAETVSPYAEPFHLETVSPLVGDSPGQCADADCARRAEIGGYCEGHYGEYSQRYAGAYDYAAGAD